MSGRPQPTRRDEYAHFTEISTRWADNDAYGHMNNVVYYEFFDSAVNRLLIERGVLDVANSPEIGLVAETHCSYFSSLGFPDQVFVGMKVVHLGNSSVRYEIALFRNDNQLASAVGSFVHVYVERETHRATTIPQPVREILKAMMH